MNMKNTKVMVNNFILDHGIKIDVKVIECIHE